MPYVRTVKTASGATAVQVVHSSRRGSRDIEHIGSAHDDGELELLKAATRQRLAAGQGELDLDLGLDAAAPGGPLPITASGMGCLLDALTRRYDVLGPGAAAGGDEVFRDLALARITNSAAWLPWQTAIGTDVILGQHDGTSHDHCGPRVRVPARQRQA